MGQRHKHPRVSRIGQRGCQVQGPDRVGSDRTERHAQETGESVPPDRTWLAQENGLAGKFFFTPNHFWKHKNYRLMIESLEFLRQIEIDDVVVAGFGNPVDPRKRQNFIERESEIEKRKLKVNFRVLGLSPFSHVPALLGTSLALLNPSLCGGWSTTVEDARSIGVPMIVSDFSVHREQVTANVIF